MTQVAKKITSANAESVGAVARALLADGVPDAEIQWCLDLVCDHVATDEGGAMTFTSEPGSRHAGTLYGGAEHDPVLFARWFRSAYPDRFGDAGSSASPGRQARETVTEYMQRTSRDLREAASAKAADPRQSTAARTPSSITEAWCG